MTKYYRVLKDTFMWEAGAILKRDDELGSKGGYQAISDVWDICEIGSEYISAEIIEAKENAQWFERVYPSNLEKFIFKTKEEVKAAVKFVK